MPIFQETRPKERDDVRKRTLSPDDVAFLKELQRVLNTQDPMGQADPKFWVVKGSRSYAMEPDECMGKPDHYEIYDVDTDEVIAKDYRGLTDAINEKAPFLNATATDNSIKLVDIKETDTSQGLPYRMFIGNDLDHEELTSMLGTIFGATVAVRAVIKEPCVYPNTMFLTHEGCARHLRDYGYNYSKDAHAYAMTADRSPEYEHLLRIIRTVDWGMLPTKESEA